MGATPALTPKISPLGLAPEEVGEVLDKGRPASWSKRPLSNEYSSEPMCLIPFFFFLRILFIFRERGREEKERNIDVNEHRSTISCCAQAGTEPTTQVCAPMGY